MLQEQPPATPTPPQAPRPSKSNLADVIKDAVADALAPVRAEMRAEIGAAQTQRAVLEDQLAGARSRSVRNELQSQLNEVNQRIATLQSKLANMDAKLATRDAPGVGTIGLPPNPRGRVDPFDNFNPAPMVISIMAILFIGFPLALTFARLVWRRATHATPPGLSAESGRRFDRLEQSVDAIAIEVERISENQRYLTKLLAEPKQASLKE